ncbi:MAG: Stress response protein nst1 [Chrysothrix sp. TS-e1954]|nr:MAG: Stress response protein nst1 [Chrysothrix sp. TS-e1954]
MGPSGNTGGAGAPNISQGVKPKPQLSGTASNGVVANMTTPAGATVNRKKQKRREKQAARQAAAQDQQAFDSEYDLHDADVDAGEDLPLPQSFAGSPRPASHQNPDPYGGTSAHYHPPRGAQHIYSDEDAPYPYESASRALHDLDLNHDRTNPRSKKKKKVKGEHVQYSPGQAHSGQLAYTSTLSQAPPPPPPPPPISDATLRTVQRSMSKDPIWDTSTQEERARIKDFWLTLSEQDRKSLVKIEKEAVLRKMKEQQKHSCSCTVCGRKRTAIEEELEYLYDAYYSELERFANRGDQLSTNGHLPSPAAPRYLHTSSTGGHRPSRIRELTEGEDETSQEDVDGYSDDDNLDDLSYSGDETDEVHQMHEAQPMPPDFFAFGQSLTVKGGILTVADDLLQNDGQKFIDMMEQLAERRMQREEEAINPLRNMHAQQAAPLHSHVGHDHLPPPEEEEEEYDEEEEEEDYDEEEEEYDEEEDEMAQQRMEEGRRMFQIFAARMFEQRVLTAYREKVARERQQKLIEELEAETMADSQRDAKKARDAEKKKAKKQQQKQSKAEEKARKDEQKAAEEAAIKEAEARKFEEQRLKREEQRKKKEAERRAQEEERNRKEADKQRRQQEERNRQQEVERKAREQKAEEKRRRDESKKQEREDREAKEKIMREQKAKDDEVRKEKVHKSKAASGPQIQKHKPDQPAPLITTGNETGKRPSVPAVVALPPALKTQKSYTTQPSPGQKVATPTLPKAPTPVKTNESSGLTSQRSAPQNPDKGQHHLPTTPPKSYAQSNATSAFSATARTPNRQQSFAQAPLASPQGIAPPPGMSQAPQHGPFPHIPPGMMNGYPGNQPPHVPGMYSQVPFNRQMPQTGQEAMAASHRQFIPPAVGGGAPPGMGAPGMRSPGPSFRPEAGATFHQPLPTSAGPSGNHPLPPTAQRSHSRQPSMSHDAVNVDSQPHTTQPIARPAPIRRPASTKPNEGLRNLDMNDADDIDKHLGSKALLDDADEPLPGPQENKRPSVNVPGSATTPGHPGSGVLGSPFGIHPGFGPQTHGGPEPWRMPTQSGFGQPTGTSAPGWGMPQHHTSNAPSGPSGWGGHSGFNSGPAHARQTNQMHYHQPRPITVRKLASQACQRLSMQKGAMMNGGFHDVNDVLRHIDSIRPMSESQVQLVELREILDTEGDAHNGGGSFSVNISAPNRLLMRWESDEQMSGPGSIGSSLGQIGSPIAPNGFPGGGGRRGL